MRPPRRPGSALANNPSARTAARSALACSTASPRTASGGSAAASHPSSISRCFFFTARSSKGRNRSRQHDTPDCSLWRQSRQSSYVHMGGLLHSREERAAKAPWHRPLHTHQRVVSPAGYSSPGGSSGESGSGPRVTSSQSRYSSISSSGMPNDKAVRIASARSRNVPACSNMSLAISWAMATDEAYHNIFACAS